MVRKIIKIDEEKCDGCGLCANACHESAIGIVNGKAKLLRDDFCDGLGDCLPACPMDAISFEEREAAPYDEKAVKAHLEEKQKAACSGGCPGSKAQEIHRKTEGNACCSNESQLGNWPIQLKLAPVKASYFDGAKLLISADCCGYAVGDFHNRFIKDRAVVIGCPKLDNEEYFRKLTEIISSNDIKEITVLRMEVPCCGGIEHAAKTALKNSGKDIPLEVVTLSIKGGILEG